VVKQERASPSGDRVDMRGVQPVLDDTLAAGVIHMMEQGVIVWDADDRCVLFNSRVYRMLEIKVEDLQDGTLRTDFCARAAKRGEMTPDQFAQMESLIKVRQPYAFDRRMPTGRIVLMNGRPTRDGGYVVTFSDVTDARRTARELDVAKQKAEEAEAYAKDVLTQERARQEQAHLLGQLDEWLQSCKSLDELFTVVSRFMTKLLPGSKGELYIYSNSRDALDGKCNWNTRDLHTSISADSCWSLRRGRTYAFDQGGLCLPCDHVTAHDHQVEVNEYLCIPIVAHGDTVGLLHIRFDHRGDGSARLQDQTEFAQRCGEHISMAIANARLRDELRDQSIRDPLTGLYNRRYLLDAIRREASVAERRGAPFGIIALDADKFKSFNDNHGHDAGDMVLRAIGAKMQELLVNGEIPCRFGGEEFAVLLPGAGADDTAAIAERLRDAVASVQVRYVDRLLPRITISCGVAAYPEHGQLPADLLKCADQALYRAKEDGRNCVRITG
jgi:diguanylate cyclase (GGDEF)-like protein